MGPGTRRAGALLLGGGAVVVLALVGGSAGAKGRGGEGQALSVVLSPSAMGLNSGAAVGAVGSSSAGSAGSLSLSGGSEWTPSVVLAAPGEPTRYVAMGDSYAAGTGAGDYGDTNQPGVNECRRSVHAYSEIVGAEAGMEVTNVACFGARTYDLGGEGSGDRPPGDDESPPGNEASQYDALDADVDLVTVSIGGNDVYFGDVMTYLVLGQACHWLDSLVDLVTGEKLFGVLPSPCDAADLFFVAYWQPKVDAALAALGPKLEVVYRTIRDRAPNAQILVVGYPRPFPDGGDWFCPSSVIASSDQRWVNQKGAELNA